MKQDNGAETRWTETDARRVWSEWRAVGGSLEAFARRNGFQAQRLQWWMKRLDLKTDQRAQRGSFLPVVVRPTLAHESAPVAVVVNDVARLEVRELTTETAAWVGAMLTAMRERRS
jgi:hypothetical protein